MIECHSQVIDASLSHANEEISKIGTFAKSSSVENMLNNKTVSMEGKKHPIPMAIVKPKYQRSSFDERQLPAVAYINHDNAWYEKRIDSTSSTKKVILPEMEDKAMKPLKPCILSAHKSANNTIKMDNVQCSTDGTYTTIDNRVNVIQKTKKKSSTVAIVQPRKKEKMDEREVMQIIAQMQIKKNARMLRNQSNATEARMSAQENNKTLTRKLRKHQKDESGSDFKPLMAKNQAIPLFLIMLFTSIGN